MVPLNILLSGAAVGLASASHASTLQYLLTAIAIVAGSIVVSSLIITRIILRVFFRH